MGIVCRAVGRMALFRCFWPWRVKFKSSHLIGFFMKFHIEHELEADGRWLAEVPEIPGALAYGATADEAMGRAESLALRALAERIETGENRPMSFSMELVGA
jgi:predicted RNase H-like HicB family nuclease